MIKVIGLNTEVCNNDNRHLFNTLNDPGEQFAFLKKELDHLEKNNGFAFIIGHVNFNDGCNNAWALRYKALLERYQHIIRMSLFAHTHTD